MTQNDADAGDTKRVFVVLVESQDMSGSWVAVSGDVYETEELAEKAAAEYPKPGATKIGEWSLHRDIEHTCPECGNPVENLNSYGGIHGYWHCSECEVKWFAE